MVTDSPPVYASVDVEVPPTLWAELDEYATVRGYRSVDDVIAEAIAEHAD